MLTEKDIEWLIRFLKKKKKNKSHPYSIYKRLDSELKTQTESERIEKGISYKQKLQESRGSYTHIK